MEVDFKVSMSLLHWQPGNIFLYMPCLIISTNLEVASILTKAKREHALLHYVLLKHHIIDSLKLVHIVVRLLL